ncbi:class I SAM-dependent methyltransferase [Telmatospirillum sp. J64-1]|uniref:class I SAM-dependent methyltransferase n=1 Tax=Telmatospirillum sp. J64-1 TaxID=2502183 RepID=UPI00115D467A|nr:class I SAM-dependent methyltransferase [Telmatospirillum sp. J64-1]
MPSPYNGYVAEIDYSHAFYPEIAPTSLAFALLLKGVQPPRVSGDFAYCELGCGQGLSSNLLAGMHPRARFWGVDFLPSHIAGARHLAEEAGHVNAVFLDDSFEDFAQRPGPDFDIIALHGVWSWVSAENRAILVDILRRRLKPGGMVYVSYNCLPGWAADMPVRQLLLDQVSASVGPLPERIEEALRFGQRLSRLGGYFDHVAGAGPHLDSLLAKSDSYIAHEYLNRDWAPFYHAEVARDLEAAKLNFAASATLLDHLEDWRLAPDALALLAETSDPTRRETLRDYLTYTRFRRDIFIRGPRRLAPSEREARLRDFRFGLCVPRDEVPESVSTPKGEIALPAALYAPLADALAAGPQGLSALLKLPALAEQGFEAVLTALTALVGLGVAVPVPPEEEGRAEGCARFNHAVLRQNRHAPDLRQLASPVLGTGLQVDLLDRLFLLARQEGREPAAFAWTILSERGKRLRRNGEWLETAEENLAELGRLHDVFTRSRLPLLRAWGIVEG